MKFTDATYIYTAQAACTTFFTAAEVVQAEQEMLNSGQPISAIEVNGIHLGLTQNKFGKCYPSAYAGGMWLGMLNIERDGRAFLNVTAPAPCMRALGTSLQARAVEIAAQESIFRGSNLPFDAPGRDDHYEDIRDLRADLREMGIEGAAKRPVQLTPRTSDFLQAGGNMSARINAIVARYEAMCADPSLLPSIAVIEAAEQAAKPFLPSLVPSAAAQEYKDGMEQKEFKALRAIKRENANLVQRSTC